MSWMDGWLNQSVAWEVLTSDADDEWEGPLYGAPQTIQARKEEELRERPAFGGVEVRQGYTIWVTQDVAVGDKLDGEIVQGRKSLVDLDGILVGYEVRTER